MSWPMNSPRKESTTDQVIRDIEADEPGPGRLKRLVRRAFDGRLSVDRAVRSWAAQDEAVAKVVASVDARRVAYIAKLLVAAGVEKRKALDAWAKVVAAIARKEHRTEAQGSRRSGKSG